MLTIKSIDYLHPLALSLLNVLFLKGIFSLDELCLPFLDPVLRTQPVDLLVYIGTGDLDIRLVITG